MQKIVVTKNLKEGKTMVQPFWDLIMGFGMSTQYTTKYAKSFVNFVHVLYEKFVIL